MALACSSTQPSESARPLSRSFLRCRKVQQGKRGNRSHAQKRRKSDKLEKALSLAGKMEKKAGRTSVTKQARKQAKGLWSKGGEEGGAQ
jgi:hypothetical protein